jgi:hypothetical protein
MEYDGHITKVIRQVTPPIIYEALDSLCFMTNVQILRYRRRSMFFQIKRRLPIYDAIEDFSYARRKFLTIHSQCKYLYDFVKITGVERPEDIEDLDIESFEQSIKKTIPSEFRRIQAMQAINLFIGYMTKRVKESKKTGIVGRPPKSARNDKWMKLKASGWSYKQIADQEGLKSRNSVAAVIKRLQNKAE